jgi:hypothetical protein
LCKSDNKGSATSNSCWWSTPDAARTKRSAVKFSCNEIATVHTFWIKHIHQTVENVKTTLWNLRYCKTTAY